MTDAGEDDRRTALELTDWRRRVARLYAEVRGIEQPAEAHQRWRSGRDELFRTHPQSPLGAGDPLRASGLPYWPYDPSLRFELPLRAAPVETLVLDTGSDGATTMRRIGTVELPAPVGGRLDVWWLSQYGGGVFLPMRDGTAGDTSYGAGRYLLDTAKGADLGGDAGFETLVVDLNFAYHPSCRYDPRWVCPLAQAGNRITARVEAGERLPPG